VRIKLLPHQKEFITSKIKYPAIVGGVGSGKSFCGCAFSTINIQRSPESIGLIAANSYPQLMDSTMPAVFDFFDLTGIPYSFHKTQKILTVYGTTILCRSLDKYDFLRGLQLGWFWIDEGRDAHPKAIQVLEARLRCNKSAFLQGGLTTTPVGFDWIHQKWTGSSKNRQLIQCTTMDNPHLPEGYADDLKESYDDKTYQQEVLGKFLNIMSGAIYRCFDRNINVSTVKRNPTMPIYIGQDFNTNPGTAVLANITKDSVYVFDEVYLMDSDTDVMAKEIKLRYGSGHEVIPDATGKAIKSSAAGRSDHSIMRQHGFRIPTVSNPYRKDRYNAVNNLLEKKRILIDHGCKKLIRDLEQVAYKEGSTLPNINNTELTHISDALGYLVHHTFPIVKPKPVRVSNYV